MCSHQDEFNARVVQDLDDLFRGNHGLARTVHAIKRLRQAGAIAQSGGLSSLVFTGSLQQLNHLQSCVISATDVNYSPCHRLLSSAAADTSFELLAWLFLVLVGQPPE